MRKPTRQGCGVGIHVLLGINLKSINHNQEPSRYHIAYLLQFSLITIENGQASHIHTSFAFSHWIFFARTYVFTNYQATHSPTYQRMVGACVLVVSYSGNKGSYNVAGKSFLYLVIIQVHRFHEVANCCKEISQRLALHDLNTKFLKSECFIKGWLSSK